MLNKAILKLHDGIVSWDIPKNYLCRPIPGSAYFIHHSADLLASCNNGDIHKGKTVSVLNINF